MTIELKDNNINYVVGVPVKSVSELVSYVDSFMETIDLVCEWGVARNMTEAGGATSYTQINKLLEEVNEFRDATTEEEAKLEFGDILIVCIQIARLRGLDLAECLNLSYQKIKDRKGTMIDGVFVKESN